MNLTYPPLDPTRVHATSHTSNLYGNGDSLLAQVYTLVRFNFLSPHDPFEIEWFCRNAGGLLLPVDRL